MEFQLECFRLNRNFYKVIGCATGEVTHGTFEINNENNSSEDDSLW